ncbi:MAG: sigma-54 dependent transcriptional regulator [Syntrophorhabdales bacterium]|jgi:DNA-binding NtrC family response regulator
MTKVLLVDDEEKALTVLCRSLEILGYQAEGISRPGIVCDTIKKWRPDVVFVDLMMPEIHGLDLLQQIKAVEADLPVIVLTGYGTVKTAVEAMKRGAFDYVTKPYNIDEIDLIIKRAIEQRALSIENKMLRERLLEKSPFSSIVTTDKTMKKLLHAVETLSSTDSTVLITGESGTGKELIAKALHYSGTRRDCPFVLLDCSGLPDTILESEIFGHVRGSFTGAYTDKKGYLEVAEKGSVFFDEISELPYPLQKKLLRVIQEKEFSKVGDTRIKKANIRIIAATNRDLKAEVGEGRFREDLYYRLNVVSLRVPPLRERRQDIPLLTNYFLTEFNARFKKRVIAVADTAYSAMTAYQWPGNVRELRNALERAVTFKEDNTITLQDLPEEILSADSGGMNQVPAFKEFKEEKIDGMTREYITTLLAMYKGNVSKSAARADLDRANFRKLLKRFHVSAADYR